LEVFAFGGVLNPFGNDVEKVFSQNERHSFAVDSELLFEMTQEVPKVYVKDIAVFIDHDVVWIAIADPENKSGYTVASTRMGECFNSLLIPKIKQKKSNECLFFSFCLFKKK